MTSGEAFSYKLKLRQEIPYFSLPSSGGKEVSLWDYKQKKNLIIVFHHGSKCARCQKKLEEYAEVYERAEKLDAELAISSDTPREIEGYLKKVPLPFPLLSDSDGKVAAQFTYIDSQRNAPFPSIFITDRFGELHYQKIVSEADELPSGDEVLDWFLFIQIQCTECSHL